MESLPTSAQRPSYVVVPTSTNFDTFFIRADFQFSPKDSLAAKFNSTAGNDIFPLDSQVPGFRTSAEPTSKGGDLRYDHLTSSPSVFTVSFGFNRFTSTLSQADPGPALPYIKISGFSPLGLPLSVPAQRAPTRSAQARGTWEKISPRHNLTLGGEFRSIATETVTQGGLRGAFLFSSLVNFLRGKSDYARIMQGDVQRDSGMNFLTGFAQDSWRLTRAVTLNYGFRWDYYGVIHERRNLLSTFLPNGPGLVQVGTRGINTLYHPDLNNFGPRLGFVFDPSGQNHVLIRAGYGIFYDAPPLDYFLSQSAPNTIVPGAAYDPIASGVVAAVSRYGFTWRSGPPGFGLNTGPPFDLFVADHNLRTPYTQSYNLGVAWTPTTKTLFQLTYAGSEAHKLYRLGDLNQPTPGPPDTAQSRRPFVQTFGNYAVINALESRSSSNYNSLLMSLEAHQWHGLDIRASYSLSHSIDDASDGIDFDFGLAYPQNSENTRGERASSTFDVRHRFTATFLYKLPRVEARHGVVDFILGGWNFSDVALLQSGHPLTVVTLSNPSGTNEFADRPDLVANPNRSPNAFLAFNAFSDNFFNRFGNLPRNAILGPNFFDTDVRISKDYALSEGKILQFSAQVFNVINRSNFGPPEHILSDGSAMFGHILSTANDADGHPRLGNGGPRKIQFGLRFTF